MLQKNLLFLEFVQAEEIRAKLAVSVKLQEELDHQELIIRKEYDKVSKDKNKNKKKKVFITQQFINAFASLSKQERVEYYTKQINLINNVLNKNPAILKDFDKVKQKKVQVYIRSQKLRNWKKKMMQINRKQLALMLENSQKTKIHDLKNYIYRKSKNNQYFSFVLEAINNKPKSKYKTIHLGFTNINYFSQWYQQIKATIDFALIKSYCDSLHITLNPPSQLTQEIIEKPVVSARMQKQIKIEQKQIKIEQKQIKIEAKEQIIKMPLKQKEVKTIEVHKQEQKIEIQIKELPEAKLDKKKSYLTTSLMEENYQIQNLESETNEIQQGPEVSDETMEKPKKPNLFQQIAPDYNLDKLADDSEMVTLECDIHHRLLQSSTKKSVFKLFFPLKFKCEMIFNYITHVESFKSWNTEVQEIVVKNMIQSENTAIIYQKIKQYSKIYRPRDFLFIRHAFKKNGKVYIVDKSIQHVNYPPFLTIVRGKLRCIWGILPNAQNTESMVVIDLDISNEGYISEQQNTNLSMQYLKKLFNISNFMMQQTFKSQEIIFKTFDLNQPEEVLPSDKPKNSSGRKLPLSNKSIQNQTKNDDSIKKQHIAKQLVVKKFEIPEQDEKGQIEQEKQNETQKYYIPELDQNGLSIISYNFLKVKHKLVPWNRQIVYEDNFKEHHAFKGEWKIDQQKGGLWFVDQKKMAEQKKVLSYILSKIGKNLLSGKGILNVSLPVDIFSPQSNLQCLAKCFAYAPIFLEKAAKILDPLQQLKYVLAFGLSCSVLYLNMQKPFNPILGETFQCVYNGCPVYLQQISHHPPIAAFYMVGRGYKFYGSIQSKMELHINSGCGLNDGDYIVKFDNGTEIHFRTPGGQISGLTYGDRKLNLVGKVYYWEPNIGYFLDITFNPNKKGFFSLGKQQTPTDYLEGTLKKVRKEFIHQFQMKQTKVSPAPKDVLQQYYKVYGQWTKELMIGDKKFYDTDKDKYIKFEYQPNPLPSDANYRQDIIYRRLNNVSRSQNEKQKYEIIQRKDRKLREKYQKK